jgi:cytochrome P450
MLPLSIYFMITEPRYYQMLQSEILTAFPDPTVEFSDHILANLPFLEAVLNETLRLGSPYFVPRSVQSGGIRICDTFIPEGSDIALAAYSQQVDPNNFFPDPLVRSCSLPKRSYISTKNDYPVFQA